MSEVIRVVCPHGTVASFIRDGGIWTTVITNVQTVRDSETGEFVEYRYPIRCEQCGRPGRPLVADATQRGLNEALDALDALFDPGNATGPGVTDIPLAVWARVTGSDRDKFRHAATQPTPDG